MEGSRPISGRRENLVWGVLLVLLAAASTVEESLAAGILVAAAAVAIWRWPRAALVTGVVLALVVRPALDIFSERQLGAGPFVGSPAVVCGLLVLLLGAVIGIGRWELGRPLWPSQRLWRIHLWLIAATCIGLGSAVIYHGGLGFGSAIRETIRVGSVLAGFLLVLWWVEADPRRYRRTWILLALGALLPVAVAAWQYVTVSGNQEIPGLNRLQGTFSHPNSLGPYLVPFILVGVASMMTGDLRRRLRGFAIAAFLTLLVVQTFSRTALLTLLMGLFALPLLQARGLGTRAMVRALGVVLLLGLAGWLIAGDTITQRFADLFTGGSLTELAIRTGQENSLQWRVANWAGLIMLGLEHPWVGHGAGMTTVLNPNTAFATGIPYSAHNDFVRMFFETGVLGLACYLVYGFLLLRWSLDRARHAPAGRAPVAFAVTAALLALFFLSGGTPEFGLQTAIQYQVYGMLALLTVTERVPMSEKMLEIEEEKTVGR